MQQQRKMRRLFCALTALFLCVLIPLIYLAPVQATGGTPTGSGTSIDPYRIATLGHLVWLQSYLADAAHTGGSGQYFRQTADIDLASIGDWTPLGHGVSGGFRGTYDGQGYQIQNLKIVIANEDESGLFSVNSGKITGLGVTSVLISGGLTTDSQVGALAGINKGTIERCWSTGTISSAADATGGLVGQMTTGDSAFGITLKNAYSRVEIINSTAAQSTEIGGLIGELTTGTVTNCYSTGNVDSNATSSNSRFSGGFAGEVKTSAVAVNVFSTSIVDNGLDRLYHSGLTGQLGGSLTYAQTTSAVAIKNSLAGAVSSHILTSVTSPAATLISFKSLAYYSGTTWNADDPWDFASVWTIDSAINDGFPTLLAQQVSEPASTETTTAATTTAATTSTPTESTTAATTSTPTETTTAATTTIATTPAPTTASTVTAATTTATAPAESVDITRSGEDLVMPEVDDTEEEAVASPEIPATGEAEMLLYATFSFILIIAGALLLIPFYVNKNRK